MKNLKLISASSFLHGLSNAEQVIIDEHADSVFVHNGSKIVYNKDEAKNFREDFPEGIVHVVCTSNNDFLVFCKSAILLLNNDTQLDFIGNIAKAACSPNEFLIVVVDDTQILKLLASSGESLVEYNLSSTDFTTNKSVDVGWGKKETQFHGSEGKMAAFAPPETSTDVAKWDAGSFEITWRDDSKHFAVSWTHENKRILAIFDEEASLHSIGESTEGLELGLDWRPPARLIAKSRRKLNGTLEIVFFETNGQRHGQFELFQYERQYQNEFHVESLKFDPTGSLLAVSLQPNSIDSSCAASLLQVFTCSNYQWSVKFQFKSRALQPSLPFAWSRFNSQNLQTLHLSEGETLHSWCFDSAFVASCPQSVIAVVDGGGLKLTNLSVAVVPPPCCSVRVKLICSTGPTCANFIDISQNIEGPLAMIIQTSSILLFGFVEPAGQMKTGKLPIASTTMAFENIRQMGPTNNLPSVKELHHVCLPIKEEISSLTINAVGWFSWNRVAVAFHSTLLLLDITGPSHDFKWRKLATFASPIVALATWQNTLVFLHLADGDVRLFCHETGREMQLGRLPVSCQQLIMIQFGIGNRASLKQPVLLALSHSTGKLFALTWSLNETAAENCTRLVMDGCTSLGLHEKFLLVTSIQHELRMVSLSQPGQSTSPGLLSQVSNELSRVASTADFNANCRRLENGARIVNCSYGDSRVVLQMPRGNLELIHPRPLMLARIESLVKKLAYSDAALLMRENRVNFNLLYDIDPQQMMTHLALFVKTMFQLKFATGDLLTLFMTDLTDEDLTSTMYEHYFSNSTDRMLHRQSTEDKVNHICNALIGQMSLQEHCIPMLTGYARLSPPKLDQALVALAELRGTQGNEQLWNEGLRHLQYLRSPQELYRIALGTYNLTLAQMLAERTNMDPKEYMPILVKMQALHQDVPYQQALIDLHLERWSKALTNLMLTDRWQETMELIQTRQLYEQAFELAQRGKPDKIWMVADAWADYLKQNQKLAAAGKVHLRAGQWLKASEIFLSTNQVALWAQAVVVGRKNAPECPEFVSDSAMSMQANKLMAKLQSLKAYSEAVSVARDVVKNSKLAFNFALEGNLWNEARVLLGFLEDQPGACATLMEAIRKSGQESLAMLERFRHEYLNNYNRLLQLRKDHCMAAEIHALAVQRGEIDGSMGQPLNDDNMSDVFSTISTVSKASVATGRSVTSSHFNLEHKNKKSEKTRKWNMKLGSRNEEVALIEWLHKNVTQLQSLIRETNDTIDQLWLVGHGETSSDLLNSLNSLLSLQHNSIPNIWDPFISKQTDEFESSSRYFGRKLYEFNEQFLRFPPAMPIQSLKKTLG